MSRSDESVPREMNAVTIDRFGGPEVLRHGPRPVPDVGPGEVLVRVAYAGVGTWDPEEREGGFVEITGEQPTFPFTPGGDGSGTVVAVGAGVDRFGEGDLVYAVGSGFYSEYVSLDADADAVAPVPEGLDLAQAGAMPIVALTALRGLVEELRIEPGESVLITGASGDVGHLAVQLAKRLGARVLAAASGADGVEAVRELGADVAVDGRTDDVAAAAREFSPNGLDAALSLVGGPSQETAIAVLREGGRVAYPLGVLPEPAPVPGVEIRSFDLTLDGPASVRPRMAELNTMIASGPFSVRIARTFPLARASEAQRALDGHRVGKIVLRAGADPQR